MSRYTILACEYCAFIGTPNEAERHDCETFETTETITQDDLYACDDCGEPVTISGTRCAWCIVHHEIRFGPTASIGRGECEECFRNDAELFRSIPSDLNSATVCAHCL